MNKEHKRIKIALVTMRHPRERQSWSGTIHHITQALQKHCGDVTYVIDPIPHFRIGELIGKIIHKACQVFLKKNFRYYCGFLLGKQYAKVIDQRLTARRLAGQSFDVIVAPDGATDIAFLETDIPIVLTADATYGLLLNYYPEFSNLVKRSVYEIQTIQNLALKQASTIIYSSAWAARSALEDYAVDPRKVHVVPSGADFENPPARDVALARKKSDGCCLLFIGMDWQRKGGDIAFETLLKLEEMGISAELIICGCIPPPEFSHKRMKVIPHLDKYDARQRHELERLYETADFLLLPTRGDCTPIAFCEASAFGLPIITTDTGGVSEIIRDGENGYMLPHSARGDAYAEVIAKLYRDDERYAQLVRTSRTAFEERLNWDAWGVAVKKILADLLGHELPIEAANRA